MIEEHAVLPLGAKEPRPVKMRIIAAARRDLQTPVTEGKFREDLFYRLSMVRLRIPPLRERRSDIPLLFAHFVAEAAKDLGQPHPLMTDSIRSYLLEYG